MKEDLVNTVVDTYGLGKVRVTDVFASNITGKICFEIETDEGQRFLINSDEVIE